MKVIFLKDYQKTIKKGQLKEVADGLARNFLFPQKIASPATAKAISELEERLKLSAAQEKKAQENKKIVKDKLAGQEIAILRKANKNKIFGSIGKKDIILELSKQGIEISSEDLDLKQPIKKIGRQEIKLFPGEKMETKFFLDVKAE